MDGNQLGGLIGGIVGALIGLAGGAAGTYFGIKNTHSPRERTFMIRAAAGMWAAVLLFLAGLLFLPGVWKYLLWIPFAFLLPIFITVLNRRQAAIRREEAEREADGCGAPDPGAEPLP
jgi:fatty acid desaturase